VQISVSQMQHVIKVDHTAPGKGCRYCNPPQELLSRSPEITGLTEIVDFRSVYCIEQRA